MSSVESATWAVTPKYLLRKDCVKHQIRKWTPSKFLEFGAGTGNFTRIFLDRGFDGVCYDLSGENREMIRRNLRNYEQLDVIDDLKDIQQREYEYIFAIEVMEHIENDQQALKEWAAFLKDGGRVLLTVPAHQRKFGKDDAQVGHVRRYEKAELEELLCACGFEHVEILNYGFPLGNLSRKIRNWMLRHETPEGDTTDAVELSMQSGRSRSNSIVKLSFLFNKFLIWPFLILQRMTWKLDLGDGYVVTAKKVANGRS